MEKITIKKVKDFFKRNKVSSFKEFANEHDVSERWVRNKLNDLVVSSINPSGIYITLKSDKKFNKYGLIEIDNILFSESNTIKSSIYSIINKESGISSKKLSAILNLNISAHISSLVKEKNIFMQREGRHFLFSIEPFRDSIVIKEELDLRGLKSNDKVLSSLQILLDLMKLKKVDVARKHKVTVETVNNIEKRFNKDGVKGLIHTRKSNAIKISSPKEAAIIAEAVHHPDKTAKEIKESLNQVQDVPIRMINKTIKRINELSKSKKTFLLEIQ